MPDTYLPISKGDLKERGWERLDFIIVSGDAYVDHPSFGTAVIGRVLESHGYKVGIIAQPNWRNLSDFKKLGRPRLAFLITSGNIDSMVNHYTTAKKHRSTDAYSPGGKSSLRPDRATIVYSQKVKEAYGSKVPIIIGGIEASLRRMAHYDYWDNKVRRSILLDAKADLLVYGMGENQIVEIAEALEGGLPIEHIIWIRGTVYKTSDIASLDKPVILPTYDDILASKETYAHSFMRQYQNTDAITAEILVEPYRDTYVVQNPPSERLSSEQLDTVYNLPYTRNYHPIYEKDGGIPAINEIKFSLVSSRGCYGGCSFCALTFHQGRTIQARSAQSLVEEAIQLTADKDFKGYIHDVGGPTANFRNRACHKQKQHGVCKDRQCLFPNPCKQLIIEHDDYLNLLRQIRSLPKVKKVFIRSGIRYDYLMYDDNPRFFEELCQHHVSGQLKVAPEHISERVLEKMGKPKREVYDKFVKQYFKINDKLNMKQYIVPYFMSSHPGSDLNAAIELAEYIRDTGYIPEQVQDFYPTPGTLSTCMYYTELDPRTMKPVYVPKNMHEKAMQRALIQYKNPKNYDLVYEALKKAERADLIGYGPKCLIRPKQQGQPNRHYQPTKKRSFNESNYKSLKTSRKK